MKYEYDRFGPWILEINKEDTLPPLFVPHVNDDKTPLLSLKIPRDIERRNAHPGMDLYDYVVNIYDDTLLILERSGKTVNKHSFLHKGIKCIQIFENLLKGAVHFYTEQKRFNLPFNTVSSDIILKMVSLMRNRYIDNTKQKVISDLSFDPGDTMSYFFSGIMSRELSKNSGINVLMAQPEVNIVNLETRRLRKLQYALTGKKLAETLILSNGSELTIYNRGQFFRSRRKALYSRNIVYIPIENVSGINMKNDKKLTHLLKLTLSVSDHLFPLLLMQNNPSLMPFTMALAAAANIEPPEIS